MNVFRLSARVLGISVAAKNKPFIVYLLARAIISLASTMLSVSIGWHLYQITGDPFDLALVGLVQVLPILMLFVLTGWVVDHFPRKQVLILCAASEALVFLGLALAMQAQEFSTTPVFALLFLHGSIKAFYSPALQAVLPNIVPRESLSRAVAITTSVWNSAMTAGPFLAGLLIARIDLHSYALFTGLSLLSVAMFVSLPVIAQVAPLNRGRAQLLSGIHYIKSNPIVLGSLSLDLVIILVGSVMALLPVYVVDVLHAGPSELGLLRAMPAIGAVVMGLALSRLPAIRHAGYSLFAMLLLFAIAILVFALSTALWLSLVALLVYGAADMVSVNIRSTLIQLGTPDSLRGRVSAVNSIFIVSSNQLGDFRAGAVAAWLGLIPTLVVGGLMAVGIAIGGYIMFPGLRRLDRLEDASVEYENRH